MALFTEITERMDSEIQRLQDILAKLDPKSTEYRSVNQQLDVLMSQRYQQYKDSIDMESADSKAESDMEMREKELAFQKEKFEAEERSREKDRKWQKLTLITNIILTGVRVAGNVFSTGLLLKQGYAFEETGKPTSITFREIRSLLTSRIKHD